jgi:hypothetical protein
VKGLYNENYKTRKKFRKTSVSPFSKGEKTSYVHGLEGLILLKCSQYPKQSTDSIWSIKMLMAFFTELEKNSKINRESRKTQNSQKQYWAKRVKLNAFTIPDFKTFYRTIVTKTLWFW